MCLKAQNFALNSILAFKLIFMINVAFLPDFVSLEDTLCYAAIDIKQVVIPLHHILKNISKMTYSCIFRAGSMDIC
jgi:hypothetical protein